MITPDPRSVQAVAEAIQDWTIPGVPPEVVAEVAVAAARPLPEGYVAVRREDLEDAVALIPNTLISVRESLRTALAESQ